MYYLYRLGIGIATLDASIDDYTQIKLELPYEATVQLPGISLSYRKENNRYNTIRWMHLWCPQKDEQSKCALYTEEFWQFRRKNILSFDGKHMYFFTVSRIKPDAARQVSQVFSYVLNLGCKSDESRKQSIGEAK